ncbi:hypothetical protein MNEG_9760 [Monoraphidium neglectum]|jgi:hypothetical protein|uniref:Uncharacterized protein n=1 Tax=Monoraphidium neglectum TaxID=145388 RepID=A0A0D2M3R6_9CHLO|nr:hypothetical protein MNEG_9760 [Monoraphidium neglectum]KIY98199.1 hypothetical protein MNEG_9760 [Monoraphidium neglectum]|eukprot:XP_013897219.1 hypothetical protein MNEG_9760 [Monoraphidium neglectum]
MHPFKALCTTSEARPVATAQPKIQTGLARSRVLLQHPGNAGGWDPFNWGPQLFAKPLITWGPAGSQPVASSSAQLRGSPAPVADAQPASLFRSAPSAARADIGAAGSSGPAVLSPQSFGWMGTGIRPGNRRG